MLKKLITLLLILSIFIVHAHASTNDGLKAAFNELNHSLTVDWDQKDKEFHAEQMKKFSAAIRDLQTRGLTNSQLLDFAKSQVNDAQVVKDLEVAFNMIQINKMSGPEANKYILDIFKKSYSTGASWNGDVVLSASFIVVVTVLLFVIVKSIVQEIKNPGAGAQPICAEYAGTEKCGETCIDVYDSEHYYTGQTCSTSCSYDCLRY